MIHNLFSWFNRTNKPLEVPSKPTKGFSIDSLRGQRSAKQAVLVASAGRHNILLVGSPGCGKSLLVSTMPSFLPKLSNRQLDRTQKLYKLSGNDYVGNRQPFRSVHHSVTPTALIGGYKKNYGIVPGEITLANYGILLLDELAEFDRKQLDLLRQPLENKRITISRLGQFKTYNCDFQLVATSNPCQCGYAGTDSCICSTNSVRNYAKKISGPIADRIDVITKMDNVASTDLRASPMVGQSERFYIYILKASIAQFKRNGIGIYNSNLQLDKLKQCTSAKALDYVYKFMDTNPRYSVRRLVKTLRISRTIADLKGKPITLENDIRQAMAMTTFSIADSYCSDS